MVEESENSGVGRGSVLGESSILLAMEGVIDDDVW